MNILIENVEIGFCGEGDVVEVDFFFECWLMGQEYMLMVVIQYDIGYSYDWFDDVIVFQVVDLWFFVGVVNFYFLIEYWVVMWLK